MVLNPDCVRDVLLTVESCSFNEHLKLEALASRLPSYTKEELWYTCIKLNEGGYLKIVTIDSIRVPMPTIQSIADLTYSGHEFLNSIRVTSNWSKIKNIAKQAGNFSLKALGDIAQEITKEIMLSALQQHP